MVHDSLKLLKKMFVCVKERSGQAQVESSGILWDYQHLSASAPFGPLRRAVQVFTMRMRKIESLSLIKEDHLSPRMVGGGANW